MEGVLPCSFGLSLFNDLLDLSYDINLDTLF
jgi:hypothetical protein